MSNNNRLIGIRPTIVYGNPKTKKAKDYKNDVRRLNSEYSNIDWNQMVDRIMEVPLPDVKQNKKGGKP
ncbi:hypothetical protein [Paraflavitalea speifideaquila]|uniref:hypothetical protein n=1 Tax=Paraflavitalea speifideaquila TaxID=3076558 RepID=UPI0028E8A1AF|nr:hypothetical protein [Paraflavitalea speifideiaquila]